MLNVFSGSNPIAFIFVHVYPFIRCCARSKTRRSDDLLPSLCTDFSRQEKGRFRVSLPRICTPALHRNQLLLLESPGTLWAAQGWSVCRGVWCPSDSFCLCGRAQALFFGWKGSDVTLRFDGASLFPWQVWSNEHRCFLSAAVWNTASSPTHSYLGIQCDLF